VDKISADSKGLLELALIWHPKFAMTFSGALENSKIGVSGN
jgi:hypothetical protein